MRLDEIATKGGREITFNRIEDSEGDKNRGWQVDKLIALIDDKEAGYIKMSYIPKNRFERYYPTVFNFLSQIHGYSPLPYKKQTLHFSKLSQSELAETWHHAFMTTYRRWPEYGHDRKNYLLPDGRSPNNLSKAELVDEWKELEVAANKNYKHEFKKFEKFHVDRPIVDFIRVHEPHRRQYIGTALYNEGARWMKEKGFKLYASGIQSPQAKTVWTKFEQEGKVGKDELGQFLRI